MGGLEIDVNSACLNTSGKAITGLYAAGEVAGGVHGNNRLGGNSLLDCVTFGRVSGAHAANYMLGGATRQLTLNDLSGGGLTGEVKSSKLSGGAYEDTMNQAAKAPASGEAPASGGGGGGGAGGYTLADVAKHTTKTDCWVVVSGNVLDVTSFLSEHPGGELAILTFGGKDATEEFDMIHPPDVIGKYAPDAIIGKLVAPGAAGASNASPAAGGGVAAPLLNKKGPKDYKMAETNRQKRMKEHGKIPGFIGALGYMILGFMKEILFTIIPQNNLVMTNDRVGLTRSAMFLFVFIIIHAVGNLHVFLGPDDFNGYGYFYVRLYWTGFGAPANIVEEYVLLGAMLHVAVALKRTWDISINYTIASGKMNLAISGILLLTFMTIHLFQFRFGETEPYTLCPPPYMINVESVVHLQGLNLFWVDKSWCNTGKDGAAWVTVRDIYRLEFAIFKSLGWVMFYLSAVAIFSTHMCLGWQKCVPAPALEIPKRYHGKAIHIGYIMTAFLSLIYISFPVYAHIFPMDQGSFNGETPIGAEGRL